MHKVIYILIFFLPFFGFGQVKSIGTPYIQNYPKTVYKAGTQNWGIAEDNNGFMYFANNDGVLRFDGLHWDLIKISPSSPVRSICIDDNNKIYVGLFNDFGILEPNDAGVFIFKSLRNLLNNDINDFDDIWRIFKIPQGIIFQTFEYLFILDDNNIDVIKPNKSFRFSFNVNGRLFLHEPGEGIFEYENGVLEKVPWSDELKNKEISAVIGIQDDQLLIGTIRSGIYLFKNGKLRQWNTPVNDLAEKNKLFCATKVLGNYIAFGTILDGVIISDYNGNVLQSINRNQGLQNNTVLTTFSDSNQNLWLGLDNGIDYVEINSPMSFISDFEGLGTGYCCRIFNGKIYLGTNQGLYVKSFENFSDNNEKFELIKNTAGQVWSLNVFDGQLICCHNSGTFRIKDKEVFPVNIEQGAWKFIKLKNRPDLLLGGNYNGLTLLKKATDGWKYYKKVEGFNESSRFLQESDDGTIWISHGGKGIFKVILSESKDKVTNYDLYTSENGLPSDGNNILFELKGKEYVSSINGIYAYNPVTDSFSISAEVNKLFDISGRLKTIETDASGNIWYISEKESGVLRLNEDLTYTKINSPFKQLEGKYVNEFEFIYPYNDENIFIGIDNGFAHYSSKFPKSYATSFQSFITKVELPYIDSILNFSNIQSNVSFEFPYKKNSFRFNFTAPFYEESNKLEFSYFLENYSDDWSDWSAESFKDFTNLREGDYTFQLKAKNVYNKESEISLFKFRVKPPWYRSILSFYCYVIALFILIFLVVKFVRNRIKRLKMLEIRKHERELKKKEKQFQHKAMIAEKEIIRLRNETLQSEVLHRNKELTNQTINIIQKNKFLIRLNEELHRIQSSTDDAAVKTKMVLIKKRILKEIDDKQQNRIFETYFDEVHEEFFKRLKEKYPDLSPKDLRLCAFIRMDISSKEISSLLNISYRGVEINRYRLRKKLELSREINLPTFLSGI